MWHFVTVINRVQRLQLLVKATKTFQQKNDYNTAAHSAVK